MTTCPDCGEDMKWWRDGAVVGLHCGRCNVVKAISATHALTPLGVGLAVFALLSGVGFVMARTSITPVAAPSTHMVRAEVECAVARYNAHGSFDVALVNDHGTPLAETRLPCDCDGRFVLRGSAEKGEAVSVEIIQVNDGCRLPLMHASLCDPDCHSVDDPAVSASLAGLAMVDAGAVLYVPAAPFSIIWDGGADSPVYVVIPDGGSTVWSIDVRGRE